MTAADQIAASLAREFPVSARLLARGPAFRGAVDEALGALLLTGAEAIEHEETGDGC